MKKEFKFKVNALRTLSSPYKNGENMDLKSETVYYLLETSGTINYIRNRY